MHAVRKEQAQATRSSKAVAEELTGNVEQKASQLDARDYEVITTDRAKHI